MKNRTPVISVVIPAYNEEKRIGACLDSLFRQQFSHPYEVIVSDNNSKDATVSIAKKYNVTVVRALQKGYAHALRTGVSKTRSDIVLITDADVIVPEGWIQSYYDFFQKNPTIDAASGPFLFTKESPFMHMVTKLANRIYPKILVRTLIGMNMGFRREIYESVGGFDTSLHLSADSYLGAKIKRIGKIGFIFTKPVIASGRRFHKFSIVLWDGLLRWGNFLSLYYFDRPLITNFKDIR